MYQTQEIVKCNFTPKRINITVGSICTQKSNCAKEQITFILGHALYMKAIHGGKAKSDKIDSEKVACLIKGGNFPLAYIYPATLRPIRDLLQTQKKLLLSDPDFCLVSVLQPLYMTLYRIFRQHLARFIVLM